MEMYRKFYNGVKANRLEQGHRFNTELYTMMKNRKMTDNSNKRSRRAQIEAKEEIPDYLNMLQFTASGAFTTTVDPMPQAGVYHNNDNNDDDDDSVVEMMQDNVIHPQFASI